MRLETDARGAGVSRLVWSAQARKLSRPDPNNLGFQTETEYEQKILEGIGRGFDPLGAKPELIVIPDTTNSNSVYPKIEVTILSDGSLKLEIIDDVNTPPTTQAIVLRFIPQAFRLISKNSFNGKWKQ